MYKKENSIITETEIEEISIEIIINLDTININKIRGYNILKRINKMNKTMKTYVKHLSNQIEMKNTKNMV